MRRKHFETDTFFPARRLCGIGKDGNPVILWSQTLSLRTFIGKWAYLSRDISLLPRSERTDVRKSTTFLQQRPRSY